MPLIEWREEFSLGLPSVDHEHRELIGLINDLHASLSSPESASSVMDFLGELHARIAAHFALEEKIMRERGYDQYQDHKEGHEALLDEIRDIMDSYEDSDTFDEARLSQSLKTWFTEHFQTKDARLHKFLA
jgi:hemerythrin